MAQVFVSYSRHDSAFMEAFRLQHESRRQCGEVNFDLWIDEHDIGAGDEWTAEIDTNIRAAFALVLVMSRASLDSDYVHYEWAFARGANVAVIPVKLHDVIDDHLHMILRTAQWLNFTNDRYDWDKLYSRLLDLAPEMSDVSGTIASAEKYLKSALESERKAAFQTLRELSNDPGALKLLGDALRSKIADVRLEAAKSLLENGSSAAMTYLNTQFAIEPMSILLKDSRSQHIHEGAMRALLNIDSDNALIAALRGRLTREYRTVVERLVPRGKQIIPTLKEALETQDAAAVKQGVLEVLGEIGEDETIPVLNGYLRDSDTQVQTVVGKALLKMSSAKAYAAALASPNHAIQLEARKRLINGGKASVQPLADVMEREATAIVEAAGNLLREIGIPAVPSLIHLLDDSRRPEARKVAAVVLGELKHPAAVSILCKATKDEYMDVRLAAVKALDGFDHDESVDSLIAACRDRDAQIRLLALRSVGRRGGKKSVSALIAALNDKSTPVRLLAVEQLERLGNPAAIPHLLKLVDDPVSEVTDAVVKALLKFETLPALEAVLTSATVYANDAERKLVKLSTVDSLRPIILHGSTEAKREALRSLQRFGSAATGVITLSLKDGNPEIRKLAALVLGKTGDANSLVELLLLVNDTVIEVREAVAEAFGQLKFPLTIDPLMTMLDDRSERVRYAAAKALGKIGGAAASRLLILLGNATDRWWVRKCVIVALADMKERSALNAFIRSLQDDEYEVREAAAYGLGRVCDASAIKPLETLLSNTKESRNLRKVAQWSLKRIGTPEALEAIRRHPLQ
jgi:HEAT repeat protein